MRRKLSLTFIEVIVATVLIGFLCTGLFRLFYQSLRKQIEGYQHKEYTLQLSLFEQNCKHLFSHTKALFSSSYQQSQNGALSFQFHQKVDPDPQFCGLLTGIFYLSEKGELTFLTVSPTKQERKTLFLDHLENITFRFFSNKTRGWHTHWSEKTEELPSMLEITLHYKKNKQIPFVFFFDPIKEPISYSL